AVHVEEAAGVHAGDIRIEPVARDVAHGDVLGVAVRLDQRAARADDRVLDRDRIVGLDLNGGHVGIEALPVAAVRAAAGDHDRRAELRVGGGDAGVVGIGGEAGGIGG